MKEARAVVVGCFYSIQTKPTVQRLTGHGLLFYYSLLFNKVIYYGD